MPPDSLRREYAALAPSYERRWRHYLVATTRHTLNALAPRAGERIFDVGCGTGFALSQLANMPATLNLSGVDANCEMLARARTRLPAEVVLARSDARQLPFPNSHFDAVITTSALHYFDEPAAAIGEMARVLAPGGRLIITDWCRDFFVMFLCEHWLRIRKHPLGRVLNMQELTAYIEAAGLQVETRTRFRVRPAWGLMMLTASR
ncbi:MAG: class I SAM-dependent methyltransferase [Gammaproteobacteria bacterium]